MGGATILRMGVQLGLQNNAASGVSRNFFGLAYPTCDIHMLNTPTFT